MPAFDWPVARFPQLKYPLDEHKRENEAEEVNICNICIKPFANYLISTQIKSFIVLPILHQIKPIQVGWFISASLRPVNAASGGFRGGDGGDASPTSLKVMILAEKSASVSNNSAPFRDASPPTDLNVMNPAKNQSQFW